MKHLNASIVFVCLVAAVALLPQPALAQKNPRIGVWKLDVAKSSFQQGTAPATDTRTYLATDDGGIQMTGDSVLASGTKQPTGYRAKYDGKDHPYSGAAGDTIAITGDGWTSDATIKMAGKVTQTTHSVVSKDGKTMTLVAKTAAGHAISTRVYVKQK
ncbi:MAG: hypothetical protein JWL71_4303 [Acidobacteria bacterium]|nr:hypothetical protein [Acidobacteriota bacterium]